MKGRLSYHPANTQLTMQNVDLRNNQNKRRSGRWVFPQSSLIRIKLDNYLDAKVQVVDFSEAGAMLSLQDSRLPPIGENTRLRGFVIQPYGGAKHEFLAEVKWTKQVKQLSSALLVGIYFENKLAFDPEFIAYLSATGIHF
jgi:hypothetical protein